MAKKKKKIKQRINTRKFLNLLNELKLINQNLGNSIEDDENPSDKELKTFDEFQKQKEKLNILLDEIRNDTSRLLEIKKNPSAVSVRERIELNQQNDKKLKKAVSMLKNLQLILKKKKFQKNANELELRNRVVLVLADEIQTLLNKNTRHQNKDLQPKTGSNLLNKKSSSLNTNNNDDKLTGAQKRRELRNQKKAERRLKRKKNHQINENNFIELSQQDQMFMDEKDKVYDEQDDILGEISQGLTEILGISQNINDTLKYQSHLINEIDDQMDHVEMKLDTANDRLKELFESSGGLNIWCPRIICFVSLIAIAGYAFQTVFD